MKKDRILVTGACGQVISYLGRPLPLADFFTSLTTFFDAVFAMLLALAGLDLAFATFLVARLRFAIWFPLLDSMLRCVLPTTPRYFFRSTLCGLRLPMRPLSLPAAGSITALISVGLPESIAALTARLSSSGVVALTPTPPKASIILS